MARHRALCFVRSFSSSRHGFRGLISSTTRLSRCWLPRFETPRRAGSKTGRINVLKGKANKPRLRRPRSSA